MAVALWAVAPLRAGDGADAGTTTAFKEANRLYDQGQVAEAIAAYQKIEPKTAHVWFNLGNAWFRQNQLGQAILNYERARRLTPRDPDVLANLRFAEQRAGVEEINTPARALSRHLEAFAMSRTLNEWALYQLLALWGVLLSVAAWVWFPRLRTLAVTLGVITAVGFGLAAGLLAYRWQTEHRSPLAVVVANQTPARFAPLADATVHVTLIEGTKVRIREDRDQWIFVERADGQQGWVKADSIARVSVVN